MVQLHLTHKTNPRPICKWAYCAKCGLVYLRNKVTQEAMRKRCEAQDD